MMAQLMKGHRWKDHSHKMTYPCIVEAKHDEIRCHVTVHHDGTVDFLSFAGKPLYNLERWGKLFVSLARGLGYSKPDETVEFDLGVEVNGNFNDSYRWVRSKNGVPPELENAKIAFYLFDLPQMTDLEYKHRLVAIDVCCRMARGTFLIPMYQVEGMVATSAADVEAWFQHYRDKGLEGAMVKSLDHLYQRGKRSYGWLKMKPEEEEDGVIVGFVRAVSILGAPLNRTGSIIVRCEDGSTATPAGIAHDLGADMHSNPEKYLGQWVQFRFMMRDRQGGYRHPSFVRFREDKV